MKKSHIGYACPTGHGSTAVIGTGARLPSRGASGSDSCAEKARQREVGDTPEPEFVPLESRSTSSTARRMLRESDPELHELVGRYKNTSFGRWTLVYVMIPGRFFWREVLLRNIQDGGVSVEPGLYFSRKSATRSVLKRLQKMANRAVVMDVEVRKT